MIKIKTGVKMVDISPQITLAVTVAGSIYAEYNCDCVITSLTDGKHSTNSLHYQGDAVDLRIRNLPKEARLPLSDKLRFALGENYDVVLESDHIHVEYDPK
jgi:hypothetical protein